MSKYPPDHSSGSGLLPSSLISSPQAGRTKSVSHIRSSSSTPHHSPLLKPGSLSPKSPNSHRALQSDKCLRRLFSRRVSVLLIRTPLFSHIPSFFKPFQLWSPHSDLSPRIFPKSPILGPFASHCLRGSSFHSS